MRTSNALLGLTLLLGLLALEPRLPAPDPAPAPPSLEPLSPAPSGRVTAARKSPPRATERKATPAVAPAPERLASGPARPEAGPTVDPRLARLETTPVTVAKPSVHEGRYIALELRGPQVLAPGGRMAFVATLTNPQEATWNVVAEVVVRKGDGSEETLIRPRHLRLKRGKALRVPLALRARTDRFPPGLTEFVAFLRDGRGHLVDRASIAFVITVPLP